MLCDDFFYDLKYTTNNKKGPRANRLVLADFTNLSKWLREKKKKNRQVYFRSNNIFRSNNCVVSVEDLPSTSY